MKANISDFNRNLENDTAISILSTERQLIFLKLFCVYVQTIVSKEEKTSRGEWHWPCGRRAEWRQSSAHRDYPGWHKVPCVHVAAQSSLVHGCWLWGWIFQSRILSLPLIGCGVFGKMSWYFWVLFYLFTWILKYLSQTIGTELKWVIICKNITHNGVRNGSITFFFISFPLEE